MRGAWAYPLSLIGRAVTSQDRIPRQMSQPHEVTVAERGGENTELREVITKWRKTWGGQLLEEWVEVAGDDGIASDYRLPRQTEYWDRVTGFRTKYLPVGASVVWLQLNDANGVTYWRHKDTLTPLYNLPPLYGPRAACKCEWLTRGVPKIDSTEKAVSKMALRGIMTRQQAADIVHYRDGSRTNRRRSAFLRGLHPPEADEAGWREVVPHPKFVTEFQGALHDIKCTERAGGGNAALRLYWCPKCDIWVERDYLPKHGYFPATLNRISDTLPYEPLDFACLLWAVTFGYDRIVEFCLEQTNSETVNNRNAHGDTPLHLAAKSGWSSIASTLLWYGADFKKKNIERKTALELVDPESPATSKVIRDWMESREGEQAKANDAMASGAHWFQKEAADGVVVDLQTDAEELDLVRMQYPSVPKMDRASFSLGRFSQNMRDMVKAGSPREDSESIKEEERSNSALSTAPGTRASSALSSTALSQSRADSRSGCVSPETRPGSSMSSNGASGKFERSSIRPSSARSALKRVSVADPLKIAADRPASASATLRRTTHDDGTESAPPVPRRKSVLFSAVYEQKFDTDSPITQVDKNPSSKFEKVSSLEVLKEMDDSAVDDLTCVNDDGNRSSSATPTDEINRSSSATPTSEVDDEIDHWKASQKANEDHKSERVDRSGDLSLGRFLVVDDNDDNDDWKVPSRPSPKSASKNLRPQSPGPSPGHDHRSSLDSDPGNDSLAIGVARRTTLQRYSFSLLDPNEKEVTKQNVRTSELFKGRYATPLQLRRQTVQQMIWDQNDRNRALQYFPDRLQEAMEAKRARQEATEAKRAPHSAR